MSVQVKWGNTWITKQVTSVTWEGSATQCSRSLSVSVITNKNDERIKEYPINLGDILSLYVDKKRLFVGVVTDREYSGGSKSIQYKAKDVMHYLLKSKTSRNFRNTSAENIAKAICSELQMKVGTLAKTGIHIPKYYPREETHYNIILGAYQKARKQTKKKYILTLDGVKLCVKEKGEKSGITLHTGTLFSSSYSDSIENMVNKVRVYSEKGKLLNVYEKSDWTKKYGIYQETYTKEKGVNPKTAAEHLFHGIEKSASVESMGDIRAVSGKSIQIRDSTTGLTGKFWIENDTHTFENGKHKMSLTLAFQNIMEAVSVSEADEEEKKKKGSRAGVSSNPKINKVVEFAKSFLGKCKYQWGATTPQKGWSDCSGFTQYVFKKAAGIQLPRTSGEQSQVGTKVYCSHLKIGDLVYFEGHIGIYIGQDQFIHCEKPVGVKISTLSTYKPSCKMGRRIIK